MLTGFVMIDSGILRLIDVGVQRYLVTLVNHKLAMRFHRVRPPRVASALLIVTLTSGVFGQPPRRAASNAAAPPFSVVEASIDDMRKALEQKRTTSHEIVRQSLERIALYEDKLHAVITVNPHA